MSGQTIVCCAHRHASTRLRRVKVNQLGASRRRRKHETRRNWATVAWDTSILSSPRVAMTRRSRERKLARRPCRFDRGAVIITIGLPLSLAPGG